MRIEDFLAADIAAGRIKLSLPDKPVKEDSVEDKTWRAMIRKRTLTGRFDFSMPESLTKHRADGNLEQCLCDKCSEIKSKIPRRPTALVVRFITPTRGNLDTVLCSPASYAARKTAGNRSKYAR